MSVNSTLKTFECHVCSAKFLAVRASAKYCSKLCRDRKWRSRETVAQCSVPECGSKKFARSWCRRHYKYQTLFGEFVVPDRKCAYCSVTFTPRDQRHGTCSNKCRYALSNGDREQRRIYDAARRARKRANGVFRVTRNDLRREFNRRGGLCAYCDVKLVAFHWDHVVPLVRGGVHSVGNLVPACAHCNLRKQRRTVMEWRHKRERREGKAEARNG